MQRLPGVHRLARFEATQVDVQLAVREPVGDLVCPVNGQGRLSDPGRSVDRGDDHGAGVANGPREPGDLVVPANELPHG